MLTTIFFVEYLVVYYKINYIHTIFKKYALLLEKETNSYMSKETIGITFQHKIFRCEKFLGLWEWIIIRKY